MKDVIIYLMEIKVLSIVQDYVPNKLLLKAWRLYISVNENGIITNWYSKPSIDDFIFED
jgi:hypothetical protein